MKTRILRSILALAIATSFASCKKDNVAVQILNQRLAQYIQRLATNLHERGDLVKSKALLYVIKELDNRAEYVREATYLIAQIVVKEINETTIDEALDLWKNVMVLFNDNERGIEAKRHCAVLCIQKAKFLLQKGELTELEGILEETLSFIK